LTAAEIRENVLSNYAVGQEITMKILNDVGKVTDTFQATIMKLYPSHVSVNHNGYIESFSYWEFTKYASGFNQKKKLAIGTKHVRKAKYA
jgi:hypothetical protein